MGKIRTFLALEPSREIQQELSAVQRHLRKVAPGVGWVKEENIHLTVKFFGSIEEEEILTIVETIRNENEETPFFSASIKGLGIFPRPQRPRVIWAGMEEGAEQLCRIQEQFDQVLEEKGFPRENKKFHPHLTLGRVKALKRPAPLLQVMEDYQETLFGRFQVRDLCLFKSDLLPTGAVYTRLEKIPIWSPEP